MADDADTFDYVIVGAGAAGSRPGHRLTEDPGVTVCVLEAGPPRPQSLHPHPGRLHEDAVRPRVTWLFKHRAHREHRRPRHRDRAGAHAGRLELDQRHDLQSRPARRLRLLGAARQPRLGLCRLLPYFRRTERRIGQDDETRPRPRGRPARHRHATGSTPSPRPSFAAAVGAGIPRNPDYKAGDQAGVGYFQRGIHNGCRVSAARAFLRPGDKRARTSMSAPTPARSASCSRASARSACGTSATAAAPRPKVRARREVIVCGRHGQHGAAAAGLGRRPGAAAGQARRARRARTAGSARISATTMLPRRRPREAVGHAERDRQGPAPGGQIARWALPALDPADVPSPVQSSGRCVEGPRPARPAMRLHPRQLYEGKVYVLDDYPGFTAGAWQHRPESVGWVRARSTDVFEDPEIQPNYLTDPIDLRVHLGGIRLLGACSARRRWRPTWTSRRFPARSCRPTTNCSTSRAGTAAPPTTSSARPRWGRRRPQTVVSDRLLVHGMEGLRVADASVMPSMPSANTYATTMMIAEKASDSSAAANHSRPRRPDRTDDDAVLVLGAGALGGYFGGRLQEAGADVTFLVRPRRAAQLAAAGLAIESPFGALRTPVRTVMVDEAEPGWDLILLTCKAYDLDAAIAAIRPAVTTRTAILPVLNGLSHVATLQREFGPGQVLGGLAKIQATLAADGTVRQLNDWRWLTFGELDGTMSPRVAALAEIAGPAKGMDATAVPDILFRMWEKLVHLGTSAVGTVLMRANTGEIARSPGGVAFMHRILARNAAIAAANGHPMRPAFLEEFRALFADPKGDLPPPCCATWKRAAGSRPTTSLASCWRRRAAPASLTKRMRLPICTPRPSSSGATPTACPPSRPRIFLLI